jgi:hypothetical protein
LAEVPLGQIADSNHKNKNLRNCCPENIVDTMSLEDFGVPEYEKKIKIRSTHITAIFLFALFRNYNFLQNESLIKASPFLKASTIKVTTFRIPQLCTMLFKHGFRYRLF